MATPDSARDAPRGRIHSLVRSPLIHPVCFALFPVLFLWSQNLRDDVSIGDVAPILAVVLAGAIGIWAIFRLLLRDAARASLATSIVAVIFLTFGHVLGAADPFGVQGDAGVLLLGFVALMSAGVAFAGRSALAPRSAPALNFVAAGLVVFNLIPIVSYEVGGLARVDPGGVDLSRAERRAPDELPDIYYVVFDRYGANGVLLEQYGFDNAPITAFLRGRGFAVAEGAVANYPRTTHSLASTLNMRYLDEVVREVGQDSSDWNPLYDSITHAVVPAAFQELGYRYVNIGTFWEPTRDVPGADVNHVWDGRNEFASVFETTTMWPAIAEVTGIRDVDGFRDAWVRTERQLDVLDRIPEDPRPTFTLAHFALPHPPYVFRADGSYAPPATYPDEAAGYLAQLAYANSRIRAFVDRILAPQEGPEPIVVLQADEGPNPVGLTRDQVSYDFTRASQAELDRKLRIFAAYYLPGQAPEAAGFGDVVTPVNTFRRILNVYFDAGLPILPDRVFVYRDERHPYELHEITDRMLPEQA